MVKTATSGQWQIHGSVDGSALANVISCRAGNLADDHCQHSDAAVTMPIAADASDNRPECSRSESAVDADSGQRAERLRLGTFERESARVRP